MDTSNVSPQKAYERELQRQYDELGRLNKFDDCESYTKTLDRPTTDRYMVMADGSVEFLR